MAQLKGRGGAQRGAREAEREEAVQDLGCALAAPKPPACRPVRSPLSPRCWTGDLAHAGAEFTEDNLRIHVYIDSPVFPREKGGTFPE